MIKRDTKWMGELANDMLMLLINRRVVTEQEIVRRGSSRTRSAVYQQYQRLVARGFDIRRRIVSLPRRHGKKFGRKGVIPSEAIYYI